MERLLILTAGELTRDPRARRAAEAARARGLDVAGLCTSGETVVALDGVPVMRIGAVRVERVLRGAGLGGATPSSALVRELRGLYRVLRHIVMTLRLMAAGRRLGRFDAVHANDFDTLPAGYVLAHRLGARLVYDTHEIYTLQETNPPRLYGRAVLAAERFLAKRADAVLTVNEEISDELRTLLRLDARPVVVLNCTALDPVEPDLDSGGPLRAVYQGAMGPGRFLDDLLAAAEAAPGIRLTIRVKGADSVTMREIVSRRGLAGRVDIADPVSPEHLVGALRGFHVGLVINRPVTRNDELVLPNKLFEYLMAGAAVVAPALPSLSGLIEREHVGLTYPPGDTAALGAALTRLDQDRELLAVLRRDARAAAFSRLNAEAQAGLLEHAWRGSRRAAGAA
ncbi:MAG TPA: glycosyltransferase [Gaiellaceae bacterium]